MKIIKGGGASGTATHVIVDSGSTSVSNFPATQAITSTDGAQATIGTTSDASSASTLVGLLKKLVSLLPSVLVGGRLDVNVGNTPAVTASWASAQHVIVDTAPSTAVTIAQLPNAATVADGTAKPSTTMLEAILAGLDSGGNLDLLRTALATAAAVGTVGVLADVPHFWDVANATYTPGALARAGGSALDPTVTGQRSPAVVAHMWDDSSGVHIQLRGSRGITDGLNGQNSLSVAPVMWNGASFDKIRGDASKNLLVAATSLPLPSGAATSALQSTLDLDLQQIASNAAPQPWFTQGQGTFFATGAS